MITENEQSVNTENAVECEFGNAIRELNNPGGFEPPVRSK